MRERFLAGIGSVYDNLAYQIDQWMIQVADNTAKDFFKLAGKDLDKGSIVEYSPQYAETYFQLVNPETAPSLAAVNAGTSYGGMQVQRMKMADIKQLRSHIS